MRSETPEGVPPSTDPGSDSEEGDDTVAIPTDHLAPSQPRKHLPLPKIVLDSGLWVWIWLIGAIVLIVLIFLLVSAVPTKKGVEPMRCNTPAAIQQCASQVTPSQWLAKNPTISDHTT